ncbi:unnamed protein product, partial [Meganyctiphanes norvegica]
WQRYITAVESVQREILDSCNVTKNQLNTLPMASPNPCHDFKILTPKLFYPISWMWTLNIFSPKEGYKFDEKLKDSYVLHVSSGNTFNKSVVLGKKTIYEKAAEKFCPVTYKVLWSRNIFF